MQITKQRKNQQGFILPLALLMMLFVGLVVFTSAQRTGQEAKVAQTDASLVTKQAAAEAGFYTLRQQINKTIDKEIGGVCSAETTIETVCECLEAESLKNIMTSDVGGYPSKEVAYGEEVGGQQVKWWFKYTLEDFTADKIDEVCRIAARIFVGDPAENPSYFMAANIEIKDSACKICTESPSLNDLLDELSKGLDIDLDLLNELLDIFYSKELGFEDDNMKLVSVDSKKSTLLKGELDKDKINLIVLDDKTAEIQMGSNGNEGSLEDYKVIIISRKSPVIHFGTSGKGNSPKGLVIAPNAAITLSSGANDVRVSAIAASCVSGNNKSCDVMAGGGKLSDFDIFKPENGFMEQLNPSGTGGAGVVLKESVKMDFNY